MPENVKNKTLIRLLLISIALVTVLNGSHFWLSRVGIIEPAAYNALVEQNQAFKQRASVYLDQQEKITDQIETEFKQQHLHYKKQLYDHLYSNTALSLTLKGLKYGLFLVFLGLIVYSIRQPGHSFRVDRLTVCLGGFATIYTLIGILNLGLASVLAGFNAYVFLTFFIFFRQKLDIEELRLLSLYLLFTVGLLLLMAPVELLNAIQVFNTNSVFKKRLTGFMDQPSTMGIYVICTLSFFYSMYRSQINNLTFLSLCCVAIILIMLSGSNAAAVIFCLFLVITGLDSKSESRNLKIWIMLLLAVFMMSLYFFHGRSFTDSLAGRLVKYDYYFSLDIPLIKLLFGQGLGAASNTLLQIQSYFPFQQPEHLPMMFSVDSTPLLLVIQTGLIGCTVFYSLLLYAMIKDRQLRTTYIVFIACSLSINLIEVFPLNIVLALLLCSSYSGQSGQRLEAMDNKSKQTGVQT